MHWTDLLGHPVWFVSATMLAFVLRLHRRGRWDPRACPVQLKGKTAIVTGANTGKVKHSCRAVVSLLISLRLKCTRVSLQSAER